MATGGDVINPLHRTESVQTTSASIEEGLGAGSVDVAKARALAQRPSPPDGEGLLPLRCSPTALAKSVGEAASGFFALGNYILVFAAVLQLTLLPAVTNNSGVEGGTSAYGSSAAHLVKYSIANHQNGATISIAQPITVFFVAPLLIIGAAVIGVLMKEFGEKADSAALTPSDFGVHIKGLPKSADSFSEQELREELERFGPVHSLAVGLRVEDLIRAQKAYTTAKKQREHVARLVRKRGEDFRMRDGLAVCSEPAGKVLERKTAEESEALEELKRVADLPTANTPSGHAIVTFETVPAALACIDAGRLSGGCFGFCRRRRWRFKKEYGLSASAPQGEPHDIFWENLEFGWWDRRKMSLVTSFKSNLVTISAGVAMVVSAVWKNSITTSCSSATSKSLECGHAGITVLTVIPSVLVSLASARAFTLIKGYAKQEMHETESLYLASVIRKTVVAHYILSALVLLLVFPDASNWWARGDLVDQIFWNMVSDAFVPPVQKAVLLHVARWRRQRAELQYAENQEDVDSIMELEEWDTEYAVTGLLNMFFVAIMVSPILPVSMGIVIAGTVVHVVVHRWLLLRCCKTPRFFSIAVLMETVSHLKKSWLYFVMMMFYTLFLFMTAHGGGELFTIIGVWAGGTSFAYMIYLFPLSRLARCLARTRTKSMSEEEEKTAFSEIQAKPYLAPSPDVVRHLVQKTKHEAESGKTTSGSTGSRNVELVLAESGSLVEVHDEPESSTSDEDKGGRL